MSAKGYWERAEHKGERKEEGRQADRRVGRLIMGVEQSRECIMDDKGQSVFEFLMMLPMLFGMVIILTRVNTAIQISIVNQQYARAQTLFLAFNSPIYPSLDHQVLDLIAKSTNQMIVGVSDNPPGASKSYTPQATVQHISRKKSVPAPDTPNEEPTIRAKVRIRNTVTLCTPTFFLKQQGGAVTEILRVGGNPLRPLTPVQLNESNAIALFQTPCGSSMRYEQ
jgi:hypothetical protein